MHILSSSIHNSSGRQSMTKPSLDIFKASSIQSCNNSNEAFLHHSDTKLACEIWVGLMCAIFSVACMWMMVTLKKGESKPFNQPTSNFSIEFRRTALVRRLLQLIFNCTLQVTSLAAVTTSRTYFFNIQYFIVVIMIIYTGLTLLCWQQKRSVMAYFVVQEVKHPHMLSGESHRSRHKHLRW